MARSSAFRPGPHAFLPLTPATFHILMALAGGTKHGYGIKREVEARTDDMIRLGAGTLYAGLQRLERERLIVEAPPPAGAEEEAGRRWRFYALTALGRGVFEAELARLEADVKRARALAGPARSGA